VGQLNSYCHLSKVSNNNLSSQIMWVCSIPKKNFNTYFRLMNYIFHLLHIYLHNSSTISNLVILVINVKIVETNLYEIIQICLKVLDSYILESYIKTLHNQISITLYGYSPTLKDKHIIFFLLFSNFNLVVASITHP